MFGFGTRFFIMAIIAVALGALLKHYNMNNTMIAIYTVAALSVAIIFRAYLKLSKLIITFLVLAILAVIAGYSLHRFL